MLEADANDGLLILDADGRYLDADEAALALLGVSLEELRASAPDRFAIEPLDEGHQASLRDEWKAHGAHPLVGTAGVRRADGTRIRLAYLVEAAEHGFRARIRQIDADADAAPTVFTVGDVLREWRAAERELALLEPGTKEWERVQREIDLLRGQYKDLFRSSDSSS